MKKGIFFLFSLLLLLCGCVHHQADKAIRPSAVPEKRVTKTAVPLGQNAENTSESDDPWKQCASTESDDVTIALISELAPEEFRRRVQITFFIQDNEAESSAVLRRCMNGDVYVCQSGPDNHCLTKINGSIETSEAMREFCAESADGTVLSEEITPRNTAYEWACMSGQPVITALRLEPDAAGYDPAVWVKIPAPDEFE